MIGLINHGETATYSNLQFDEGVNQVTFRHGSPVASTVKLTLESTMGTIIQSFAIPATGSFNSLSETVFDLQTLSGIGKVTLQFLGGPGALLDLDWLKFDL